MAPTGNYGDAWWGFGYWIQVVDWEGPVADEQGEHEWWTLSGYSATMGAGSGCDCECPNGYIDADCEIDR